MSYTQQDLTDVRAAIVALGKGARVAQIRMANGKTVSYQAADLKELKEIEARIVSELARAGDTKPRSRTRLVTTGKGL